MGYRRIELNNAILHLYKTSKFKKVEIDVRFIEKITETNISYRALLPDVLRAKSINYPSKRSVNEKLESLYGASFSGYSSKRGMYSTINFVMQIVNPGYIEDNNLLPDSFKFINDIISNPIMDSDTIDEEKRLLLEEIDSIIDDKASYAKLKFKQVMFKDELYRLSNLGEKETIENIDESKLYDYYTNNFLNDKVDIFVVGDINEEAVINLAKKYLDFGKFVKVDLIDYETKEIVKVEDVTENIKSNQSHLLLGYRANFRTDDKLYFPMLLMNSILGGFSSSLLFTNVREKESLCYTVFSTIESVKGCLFIRAGIDSSNKQKALDVILEQVDILKNGDFSDEVFNMAKASFINDLKEESDSIASIAANIYFDELIGRKFDLSFGIKEIKDVTKDDVILAANNITLDTIYFLLGE